jgi:hypothetical protein
MKTGRLRPGRQARIVDVCPGGVLIETEWRLLPGTNVELQLGNSGALYRVKSTVVRCQVSRLASDRIEYRGALAFDHTLTLAISKTVAFQTTHVSEGTSVTRSAALSLAAIFSAHSKSH